MGFIFLYEREVIEMNAGISTVGVTFSYGVETVAGQKPTTFTQLHRINDLPEVNLEPETIDASALEDTTEKSIPGRSSTGGSFPVVVNFEDETEAEWEELISAFNGLSGGKRMWFQTSSPHLTKSFFMVAQPPKVIPQPAFGQNGLVTATMNLTIEEYVGLDTKVAVTTTGDTE